MRYTGSTTFLLLVTAVAGSSTAQMPSSAASNREATIRTLRDSQMVRVVAAGLGRQQGRVFQVGGTDLALAREGGPLRVPSATVDSLWVRGSSMKRGAIVGGVAGGLVGLGVGLLVNQTLCRASDSGCDDDHTTVLLTAGLGGLAAGTLVGALIGSVIPKWQRRLP